MASDADCSPANPMFASVEQQGVGALLTPGIPLSFEGTGRLPPRAAPCLGEHTEAVLAELLGVDGIQSGHLHDRGLVGTGSVR